MFTLKLIFSRFRFDFVSSSVPLLCLKDGKLHYRNRNLKGHKKRDRFLVSKMKLNFQISQRNKKFTN